MAMLIMATVAYVGLTMMEKSIEKEQEQCDQVDWNAYYAAN